MRVFPAPLFALLCPGVAVRQAHGGAQRLVIRAERPRCYGGETVVARLQAPDGVDSLLWETSVAGAALARGKLPVRGDGRATLSVRTPEVRRACEMTVRVQAPAAQEIAASSSVRVFPAYGGSRLKRLFASARIGAAEVRDEVSSPVSRFGCSIEKAGSRVALGFFEGDVLLASGEWWAGEGRFVAGLLCEHLRRGVRIVVLECAGGGLSFAAAPKSRCSKRLVFADPRHHVSRAPGLDFGWGEVPALVLDLAGNLRRVLVDAENDLPVIVESFPPEGGALLRVSLPVLSRFDHDPVAPILFERSCAWAVEAKAPEWKRVALRLGDEEELAERLRELGVAGGSGLLRAGKGVLFVAAERFTRDVGEWIESGGGGVAVVPVPGAPDSARVADIDDPILRGITPGLARRLRNPAPENGAWGEIELQGQRCVLAEGLLDRIDVGEGKAYILRVGPLDEEMTRPWREFLLQVFTNLGIQCGPAESTARGKE